MIMRKYKLAALVALCLVAILALSACAPSGINRNAPSANGEWGENVTWKYDSGTKTLTISGAGDMKEMTSSEEIPWRDANMSAEKLVVEKGILSVCDYAFYGFGALKSVELPEGLTSIGSLSFAFCGALETISFPSTLTSVKSSAFEWCSSLKSINLGSSLSELDERAFAYCRSLETAYLCSEGLVIKNEAFRGCEKLQTVVIHTADKDTVNALAFDEGFDLTKIRDDETANDEITITVNFLYADGTKAAEPKVFEAKLGTTYPITIPAIEGYTSDVTELTVVAGTEDEEYTVTYTAIPVETESETAEIVTEPEPEGEKKSLGILPIIFLVIIIAGIGVGAFFLVKSNKKEEERQKNQNKAKNRKQK